MNLKDETPYLYEKACNALAECKEREKGETMYSWEGPNGIVISANSEERLKEVKEALGYGKHESV